MLLSVGILISGCSLTDKVTDQVKKTSNNSNNSSTVSSVDNVADVFTDENINFTEDVDTTESDAEIVTSDVYGKDLDMAKRYTNSIRTYFSENELEKDVTYQTTATQEAVRSFYKTELAQDWKVSEEATDYIEFSKGSDDNPEYLTVYLTPYKNILEYELVYEPAYTEEQLKELDNETDTTNTNEAE